MTKKIFIILITLLLIAFGLLYFVGLLSEKTMEKEEVVEGSLSEILSVTLMKIPAGTELEPGIEGSPISTFKVGDLMKVKGELKLAEEVEKTVLTSEIFDQNGKKIEQIFSPEMEVGGAGFGFCCIDVPKSPGKYTLKLFLDGQEAGSVNFEVEG